MLLQLLVCIALVLVGYARAFITHPTRHRCAARGYELVCVVYGSYESLTRSMNNIHKLCMYVYDAQQIAAKCKRLFSLSPMPFRPLFTSSTAPIPAAWHR